MFVRAYVAIIVQVLVDTNRGVNDLYHNKPHIKPWVDQGVLINRLEY